MATKANQESEENQEPTNENVQPGSELVTTGEQMFTFDENELDNSKELSNVQNLVPRPEGIPVNIIELEFVPKSPENEKSLSQTKFLAREISDDEDIIRQTPLNIPDPFSGDPQYRGQNQGKLILLFKALNPTLAKMSTKDIKAAMAEYFKQNHGGQINHRLLHEYLMTFIEPNFPSVKCKLFVDYKGSFLRIPPVGVFINSQYYTKDLVQYSEEFHNLLPTKNADKPETKGGNKNQPKKNDSGSEGSGSRARF